MLNDDGKYYDKPLIGIRKSSSDSLVILKLLLERLKRPRKYLSCIPLKDLKTLRVFQKGETAYIANFDSNDMKALLKEYKPKGFSDLVMLLARMSPESKKGDLIAQALISWKTAFIKAHYKEEFSE